MAKSKVPKNLEVDGTNKLAARSKPSDKHEKANLNIEEATVASPRPSRKRAGDYFDFDGEDDATQEPVHKEAAPKSKKLKERAKTAAVDKTEKPSKDEPKMSAKEKQPKGTKGPATKVSPGKPTKAPIERKQNVSKGLKEDKPKTEQAESSKKAKKDKKKSGSDNLTAETAPKTATEKPESRPQKSKTASKKDAAPQGSTAIDPDVTMDEGPFESLLAHEQGKVPTDEAGEADENEKAARRSKSTKKDTSDPRVRKAKSTKATVSEGATKVADIAKEVAKDGTEKIKKTAKAGASLNDAAAGVGDALKKGAKDNVEKVKKIVKEKVPTSENAAEVADILKKQTRKKVEETKKATASKIPSGETPAEVAYAARKEGKVAVEKAKKALKPKEDQPIDHKDMVKKTKTVDEQSGDKVPKPKKRKASSGDAETVKADLLDPLTEHAEASAKKKQKKEKAKAKSLGDTVGNLLSSAAEGANAARASLGGLASTLMGSAAETAESAGDVVESTKIAGKEAMGKGKAIAEDAAESSGKATAAPEASADAGEDNSDSDAEPDDHTAALLAGFESEGDEAPRSGQGFEEGQKVPGLPDAENTIKKLKVIKADADEGPGVVYVGRIPHGFFEHQMRQYFSQFGDINRLRLSRNRKTGQSKHWAFIEFKSAGVAKIVADTMDNYLMFGHILKCKVVPPEQLHEDVWKGADKRFKKVPWNKLEGRKLEMPLARDQWNARNENEAKRREAKKEKMKEIGYEFEAPPLKSVDQVPVKDIAKKPEDGEQLEEEQSLVTAGGEKGASPMVVSEEVKTEKTKKAAKGKAEEISSTIVKKTKRTLEGGGEAAESLTKKVKKTKKA